ncbi:threonine synthase [Erythrobacter sp. NAP1]|uniref:SURF1 family cytochrome oxidase biogenesis protein n=1 Tax=Erythrobacter sp. NAP1 TaxID=237727 RepID=UPI0000686D93|nr:SURF1 family cytochrome oxidase biogenesis protein [Erythrobacter sp. NAP1]EAQ29518.1 threonine synthase [Erythrobacter sp. NAP1]
MTSRIPIIPTILVVAAAATMVALGIWQLGRADEKAALIANYAAATGVQDEVNFPEEGDAESVLFRRSTVDCTQVLGSDPVAGTAFNGAKGWAMRVRCAGESPDSPITIDLGFTRDLEMPEWSGGEVTGIIAPGPRLVADPPVAELAPLAKPDPGDLPNNHLAYAGQWFFFALTALVIYFLALKSRKAKRD